MRITKYAAITIFLAGLGSVWHSASAEDAISPASQPAIPSMAQFQSKLAFKVYTTDFVFSQKLIGQTPSEKPLEIPEARSWFVEPVGPLDMEVAKEIAEKKIPGIRLGKSTTDNDLALLKDLKSLHSLNLTDCTKITDAGLANLKGMKELLYLDLTNCAQITDAGLVNANLKEMMKLQRLQLMHCPQITDLVLTLLKDKKELFFLNVANCNITDQGLLNLKELSEMTYLLDLENCDKITDAGLVNLKGMTKLRELILSGCKNVTDAGLVNLKEMTLMKELRLIGCDRITDAGLANLKSMTALKVLFLIGCTHITDAGLTNLKDMQLLKLLYLIGCTQITDEGLAHLEGLQSLTHLKITECPKITDAGIDHFRKATPESNNIRIAH